MIKIASNSMKLVIAKDTDQYFGSQLRELDFPVEIFPIDPEDASNPTWDSIPDCDALFLSYQFLFAIRDNQELFQPLLNLCKRCLLYTSPSPRDGTSSRMPSSA